MDNQLDGAKKQLLENPLKERSSIKIFLKDTKWN